MIDQDKNDNSGGNIKNTIDAVTGLVKAIPIYDDAIQPAAKQIGKSLLTVTKLVNVALTPVSILVWGYDKIQDFIDNRVASKLENTPTENIITPDASVVGPALEALRFTGSNETLSEMYANLIANSMDSETAKKAHPGFVEIIKNMSSDEALLLKIFSETSTLPIVDIRLKMKVGNESEFMLVENYSNLGKLAGCKHLELVQSYLNNLIRLGLLQIPHGRFLLDDNTYSSLLEVEEFLKFKDSYETETTTTVVSKKYISLTKLGVQFKDACVADKNAKQ